MMTSWKNDVMRPFGSKNARPNIFGLRFLFEFTKIIFTQFPSKKLGVQITFWSSYFTYKTKSYIIIIIIIINPDFKTLNLICVWMPTWIDLTLESTLNNSGNLEGINPSIILCSIILEEFWGCTLPNIWPTTKTWNFEHW